MPIKKVFPLILLMMFSLTVVQGCGETTAPQAGEATTETIGSDVEDQMELIAECGIDIENCRGLFMVDWRRFYDPRENLARNRGRAMAVGFSEAASDASRGRPTGVNMGTVVFAYDGTELTMFKRDDRMGIAYTTVGRPGEDEPANVLFLPSGSYDFQVEGSSVYPAVDVPVDAPASMIEITSHADHAKVDPEQDLELAWNGGNDEDKIVIRLVPHRPPPMDGPGGSGGPPPGGGDSGGPPPGGQSGPPPGDNPDGHRPPPPPPGAIVQILDSNARECTIPAAELGKLMSKMDTEEAVLIVTQLIGNDVEHNGGIIRTVVQASDQVVLAIK